MRTQRAGGKDQRSTVLPTCSPNTDTSMKSILAILTVAFIVPWSGTDETNAESATHPGARGVTLEGWILKRACGIPMSVPDGSIVSSRQGKIVFSLRPGLSLGNLDVAGRPTFVEGPIEYDEQGAAKRAETEYDCDCQEGGGSCTERIYINGNGTFDVECQLREGCTDCVLTVT